MAAMDKIGEPKDLFGLATDDELEVDKPWSEMTGAEKAIFVATLILKLTSVLALLYLFILCLGVMGNAFKILAGKTAGASFRNQEIFNTPFAGLVLGILVA